MARVLFNDASMEKNYLYLILNVRDCSSALAVSVNVFATTATANIKRKIHHHHHLTMFQGWCNVGKCQKFVLVFRQNVCFTYVLELFSEKRTNIFKINYHGLSCLPVVWLKRLLCHYHGSPSNHIKPALYLRSVNITDATGDNVHVHTFFLMSCGFFIFLYSYTYFRLMVLTW